MKEIKFEIPADCDVDKIETQDGHIVVTFKEKERKLPKSWEEFCEMFPLKIGETFISFNGAVTVIQNDAQRDKNEDKPMLPDLATAEAILALSQLIQLRNSTTATGCRTGKMVMKKNIRLDLKKAEFVLLKDKL